MSRTTASGIGRVLKATLFKFFGDGCSGLAAALSFYTFFSLPPLLYLLLTLTGLFIDPAAAHTRIESEMGALIGRGGAEQIQTMLRTAAESETGGGIGALLGIAALLFGATASFAQLQAALNHVWRVEPDPTRGDIGNFLLKRVFSFAMIMGIVFLLLVSLVLSALLTAFGDVLQRLLPGDISTVVLSGFGWLVSFAVVTALFAVMYRVLPDAVAAWPDIRVGAAVTALFFTLGKLAVGYYLGSTDPGTAYGAAGSLALVMMWVYYSAMIVLAGAVFTYVWAEDRGRGVRPEPGAVEVVLQKRRAEPGRTAAPGTPSDRGTGLPSPPR